MPSLINGLKGNKLIDSSKIFDNGRLLNAVLENYRRIVNQLPTVDSEGESLSLTGCINAEFVKFLVKGNTYQNGEPSPSNEVPIQNTIEDNSIRVQNKNWFNPILLSQEENYNSYNATTGLWTTNNGNSYGRSIFYNTTGMHHDVDITKVLKVKPNTTYTLKFYDFSSSAENMVMEITYNDKNGINLTNTSSAVPPVITFTTPADCEYLDILRRANSGTFSFSKIQLEESTTATSYIEHIEQNLKFTLAENQKMFKGDYLAEDGIHHVRQQTVLNGTEDWTHPTGYKYFQYYHNIPNVIAFDARLATNGNCNYFTPRSRYFCINTNNGIDLSAGMTESYVNIRYEEFVDNLEGFKTWLSTHNVVIEYEVSEDIVETYTTTQKQQYEAIKRALSHAGITNISQTNDGLPFKLEVSALKDLHILEYENYLNE